MNTNFQSLFLSVLLTGMMSLALPSFAFAEDASYTGDRVCAQCHETIYSSFLAIAPNKAKPSEGFPKLLSDFTEEQRMFCYHCHVTGAGKPGGFVNFATTPDLGHVGCETCHGPGSRHAEDGDPETIVKHPEWSTCTSCHDGNRVPKPSVYGRPHESGE